VASLNSRLRDELLNREIFLRLPEARCVLDEWRGQYNNDRIHRGLNWQTPAAFAASLSGPLVGATPLDPAQTIHQPIVS